MSAAGPNVAVRAPSPLRAAPRSVVPDLILGTAVAALTLTPLTYGLSLLLGPVAWVAAVVVARRRRREGVLVGVRIDEARAVGAFVSLVVVGPVVVSVVALLVILSSRGY